MKISSLILLLMGVVFLFSLVNSDPYMFNAEKNAKHILKKAASIIEKKYNLQPSGAGLAMPGGNLREFTLCFNTRSELKKEELRMLLLDCARELLNQINSDESVQSAMVVYPFTEKNIDITIYNRNQNGTEVYDPGISTADISNSILMYRTVDRDNRYSYKNRYSETYQEALRAIQK